MSAAKELRDRYLEHVNAAGFVQPMRKAIGMDGNGAAALGGSGREPALLLEADVRRAA